MAGNSQEIFERAVGLTGAERSAFVLDACGADASLKAEVESLLVAYERGEGFLASATVDVPTSDGPGATMATPLREGPGSRIGAYKLLQQIGEGGFGAVFMAEQEKPVARKVALKIIKLGMDTRQVIARFEAERQALAMMDHPNIARVYDAGATEAGRPFFVMELVKGDPMVAYCDKHSLSIEDRLELFEEVCEAVQHAHTKGIIHRDIKPSNILVSTQDGRPRAKVIDFGIAKATSSKLTEKTLFTEHRQLIGTPEYMSPEQAEGSLDIDTRTDVYSLGVLLYELLTGTTPFSSKELRSGAYAEIQRIIREVEPPTPSTRLSNNTDTIASVAARRDTEPRRLGTTIRGELDWIVMKALEKERQRRYESANGLAMDIRRYLSGEAVVAAPPSAAYRLKKRVQRHKGAVIAGAAMAAAVLIGVVAIAWQARIARAQRDIAVAAQEAEAQQRQRADAARAEAEAQAAEARKQAAVAGAVARFQTDMLAAADPSHAGGEKVTVVQAMEAAMRELDRGSLQDQPMVEAGVRDSIGNTLRGLGRYDAAEPNLRRSLALRRANVEPGHPDLAQSLNFLGLVLRAQNRLAEAEQVYREALDIRRAALPAGHLDIATSLNNLATLLRGKDAFAEAEPLYREALAIRRAGLPGGHPDIATSLNNLATLLQGQDKFAEAEALYREALAIRRAGLRAGHPDVAKSLNNLAWLLQVQSRFTEAEPLLREGLAIRRAALPAGHPEIATSLNTLALLLKTQNRLAEAEPLYRESLAIRRAALPARHPDVATGLNNLALLLQAQDRLAEAEGLMVEALEISRAALPSGHPDITAGLISLARVHQGLGKAAEARAGWDEALTLARRASPNGSAMLARVLWRSGSARLEGKDAAALPELEEAVAMAEKFLKPEDAQLKAYRETLAACKAALMK